MVEESRQMQVVEFLISMLQKNTLEQLIERAVSVDAGGESIMVEKKVTVLGSARLH